MPGGVKVKVEKPEGSDKQSGASKQSWLSKARAISARARVI